MQSANFSFIFQRIYRLYFSSNIYWLIIDAFRKIDEIYLAYISTQIFLNNACDYACCAKKASIFFKGRPCIAEKKMHLPLKLPWKSRVSAGNAMRTAAASSRECDYNWCLLCETHTHTELNDATYSRHPALERDAAWPPICCSMQVLFLPIIKPRA